MPGFRPSIAHAVAFGLAGLLTCTGPLSAQNSKNDNEQRVPPPRGVWFSGFDIVSGSRDVFTGAIVSLNGNLERDGFAIRAYGSRVDYDLDPGRGRGYLADFMVGYMFTRGQIHGNIFVGLDYQNYKLNPDDPTAKVRGTELGLKVSADLETARESLPYYFGFSGEYSTAFNTYWARLRLGANHKGVAFGPEGIASGDVESDNWRVGGFVTFDLDLIPRRSIEVSLSAGYQFVSNSNGSSQGGVGGGEGIYGALSFSIEF